MGPDPKAEAAEAEAAAREAEAAAAREAEAAAAAAAAKEAEEKAAAEAAAAAAAAKEAEEAAKREAEAAAAAAAAKEAEEAAAAAKAAEEAKQREAQAEALAAAVDRAQQKALEETEAGARRASVGSRKPSLAAAGSRKSSLAAAGGGGGAPDGAELQAWRAESWFYLSEEGEQQGPLSVDELAGLVASSTVAADTPVWCKRLGEWQRVSDVPSLVWLAENEAKTAAAPEAPSWFFLDEEGQRQGPVDTADIGNLLASEQLTADDAVWSKAIGEWLPISSVPALAALAP
jgi:hypothetical protein